MEMYLKYVMINEQHVKEVLIGKIIEGYRIIKFLGSGKFSVVGNCLTCKNNVKLSKFPSDIKTLIEQYKLNVSDVQFYWNLAKDDCIPEHDIDGQYLDEIEGQYKERYKSCIKCEEAGDSNNHNCKSCNE